MLVVCLYIQDRQISRQKKKVSSLFLTCEKHHDLANEWMPLGGTHFPLNFVLFLWWKIVAFEGSTWRPTVHPGNFIWLSPENAVRWKREVEKGLFLSMATFFWRMHVYISDSIHFLQVYACKKAEYLGFLMKVAGNPCDVSFPFYASCSCTCSSTINGIIWQTDIPGEYPMDENNQTPSQVVDQLEAPVDTVWSLLKRHLTLSFGDTSVVPSIIISSKWEL